MNVLLDTNVLIWWLGNSRSLSDRMRQIIAASEQTYVSAVSAWEISIKVASGKLEFHGDVDAQLKLNRFAPLPITVAHGIAAGQLPLYHRDPFDRMLIAQASVESLTLMTADSVFKRYDVKLMLV